MITPLGELYAGDSWQIHVEVLDSDGNAIALAGASARYALARSPSDSALITESTDGGGINLLINGIVEINVSADKTALLDEGTYYHEVDLVTADDEAITALAEYVIVRGVLLL